MRQSVKGEQNKAFEIARNLLKSLDNETICKNDGTLV